MVSLGYGPDGKRARKKVSGKTKTEVKDKLKDLHTDLDVGVRPVRGYTLEQAVTDWLASGLPGRTAKTIEVNRDSLKPVLARIGARPLQDLTAADVRAALTAMASTHATRTVQKAHNCLTRAIRTSCTVRSLSAILPITVSRGRSESRFASTVLTVRPGSPSSSQSVTAFSTV